MDNIIHQSLDGTWKPAVIHSGERLRFRRSGAFGKSLLPRSGKRRSRGSPLQSDRPKIYLIEWESGTYNGKNHYLAGNPPFGLSFYRSFLEKEYGPWYEECL